MDEKQIRQVWPQIEVRGLHEGSTEAHPTILFVCVCSIFCIIKTINIFNLIVKPHGQISYIRCKTIILMTESIKLVVVHVLGGKVFLLLNIKNKNFIISIINIKVVCKLYKIMYFAWLKKWNILQLFILLSMPKYSKHSKYVF